MKQNLLKEMETGSKNALLKKRIITHYIYNGSSTITDLAKELDLSVPTTTKFINEMCEDNYINDYGKLETSSGRHPSLYGLNPESGYFIGVDIKKFAINIGLINFKGDMVEIKMNIPYKFENTQEALEELCALIRNFIKGTEINDKKIMNICINISGRVNPESGYSFSMFNFSERPLADVLNEKIGYPVCIDNDTRAMTYGEHMQGCVKGEKDIIFVNISWGLGIGIIIDGKVYTGKSGFSGEFGHVNVFDNEILCHCGKKGCLETEASGSALHRILLERIGSGESSILSKRTAKTGKANSWINKHIQSGTSNNRGYTIINRRLYSAANQNGNKEILIESGQQRRHGDCFQAKRQGWSSWGLHAGTEQNVRNLKRPLPA